MLAELGSKKVGEPRKGMARVGLLEDTAIVKPVLVVDLDGTLIRSDMIFETFWGAFGRDWRTPFLSVMALRRGRAALKQHLAGAATPDFTTLPYDPAVIDYITAWRAKGGRTALVTASNEQIAKKIAEQVGLFDDVYGSDGTRNLKGKTKAALLLENYPEAGFVYIGDSETDLPVWKKAKRAVVVNASAALRRKAGALGVDVEHISSAPPTPRAYLKALRPHQWLKNALVFLPMLVAHQFDATTLLQGLLTFAAFSALASSVYVLNDILDLSADRAHPRKRNRPFASGAIAIAHGTWMAAGLLALGAVLAALASVELLGIMAVYYALTMAYSLHLKQRLIIDIFVLAGLYTVRIVGGGAATGIELSVWLLAFSIFFFFALAAVKRQAELVDSLQRGQLGATGRGYHVDDLPLMSQIATGAGFVSVLVLALYVNSPNVAELYGFPPALWGICLVLLYWITRLVMVTHRGNMHDDPVVYAVTDRISQVCGILVLGFVLLGTLL